MAIVIDSVDIKGLRKTHFYQLNEVLQENKRSGFYNGNKKQYDKRHCELVEWVNKIINLVDDPEIIIPKKKSI